MRYFEFCYLNFESKFHSPKGGDGGGFYSSKMAFQLYTLKKKGR